MTVDTPRVLLVSESRITRRVVEMTCADQPIELVIATSGADGLERLASVRPAVVLADFATDVPPDGLALARLVHERSDGRPATVLLMAGQHDEVDDAAVAAAGVRAVLRKPLDSIQLVEAVRAALRVERAPAAPWPPAVLPTVVDAAAVAEVAAALDGPAGVAPEAPLGPAAGSADHQPPHPLGDADLERVAARVAAIWSASAAQEQRVAELLAARAEETTAASAVAAVERAAPEATTAAAERLVRELAPKLVAEVARLVVADVSERLVREEIARLRAAHAAH